MSTRIRHYIFSTDSSDIDTAILIKDTAFNQKHLTDYYIRHLGEHRSRIIAINLAYDPGNKVSAATIKDYCTELLESMSSISIKTLYIADSTYFKYLTKENPTNSYGSILPCKVKGYEHFNCILGVNYQAIFHNPNMSPKLDQSIELLLNYTAGISILNVKDIVKSATYISSMDPVKIHLHLFNELMLKPSLAVDIETYGANEGDALRFNLSTLESIAFSSSDSSGSAILVKGNPVILALLRDFFIAYTGKCIYHNGLFDMKHIIYHCFMRTSDDFISMFDGITHLTKNFDDTMIMTYLATNNTIENNLGLKENTLEYTGNYAKDVKNVRLLSVPDLLEYNLKDTLATYWLYNRRILQLASEDQLEIYTNIFKPAFPVLLEMMMTGLPLELDQVALVSSRLLEEKTTSLSIILDHPMVHTCELLLRESEMIKTNAKLKTRVRTIDEFNHIVFNPNSGAHKRKLFHDILELPILDYTKTKLSAIGNKQLKALINHTEVDTTKQLLQAFIDYQDAEKILSTFLSTFESLAFKHDDNTTWLNGNLRLGGTISSRLSSSEPNLQNIPSGSRHAKAIKSCFVAPEGWLWAGSDYNALESRVGAILTRDPNRIKVYTDGYDSHCIYSYAYFKDQMLDIDPDSVDSINSIAEKYSTLRSKSKGCSFALQYNGSPITLHKNLGFPMEQAEQIYNGYREVNAISVAWSESNFVTMGKQGYVTGAYGLKIRTPLIARSLLDSSITPMNTQNEFRSADNAISQSHGMTTLVASALFRQRLEKSPYRLDILITSTIHDAIYLLIREDLDTIQWANTNLIECMVQAGDPQLQAMKDIVPLLANLDIGTSWDKQYQLPNSASAEEITSILQEKVHATH